jgi:hypothetical protein
MMSRAKKQLYQLTEADIEIALEALHEYKIRYFHVE